METHLRYYRNLANVCTSFISLIVKDVSVVSVQLPGVVHGGVRGGRAPGGAVRAWRGGGGGGGRGGGAAAARAVRQRRAGGVAGSLRGARAPAAPRPGAHAAAARRPRLSADTHSKNIHKLARVYIPIRNTKNIII